MFCRRCVCVSLALCSVDDVFAVSLGAEEEEEEEDSPFSRGSGLFSSGGGLFDDNQDEVMMTRFIWCSTTSNTACGVSQRVQVHTSGRIAINKKYKYNYIN